MPTYKQLRDRIANEMQRPDLNSGSPTSPIELAIQDAVRHFKNESFYINKTTTTKLYAWKWVADAERQADDVGDVTYAAYLTMNDAPGDTSPRTTNPTPSLPSDFAQVINLSIAKDNTVYALDRVSYNEIMEMDSIYSTGTSTVTTPHLSTPAYWTYMPLADATPAAADAPTTDRGAIRIYPRPDKDYTLLLAYEVTLAAPESDTDSNFWTNDAYRMIKAYSKAILYADYLQQFELAQANEVMAESEYNRIVTASEARAFADTVQGHIF